MIQEEKKNQGTNERPYLAKLGGTEVGKKKRKETQWSPKGEEGTSLLGCRRTEPQKRMQKTGGGGTRKVWVFNYEKTFILRKGGGGSMVCHRGV